MQQLEKRREMKPYFTLQFCEISGTRITLAYAFIPSDPKILVQETNSSNGMGKFRRCISSHPSQATRYNGRAQNKVYCSAHALSELERGLVMIVTRSNMCDSSAKACPLQNDLTGLVTVAYRHRLATQG